MKQQKVNSRGEQVVPEKSGAVNVEISRDENLTPKKTWYLRCLDIWATRQIARKRGKEAEVKTTIREFFIFLSFLVTVHFVTYGSRNPTAFYYNEMLSHLFLQSPFTTGNTTRAVTFDGVSTIQHFWGFMEKPLVDGLYQSSVMTTTKQEIAGKERKVLNENKMLGVPRLRQFAWSAAVGVVVWRSLVMTVMQIVVLSSKNNTVVICCCDQRIKLRVRNDSCEVPDVFTRTFSTCYDSYSSAAEEKEPFGPRDGTAWEYSSSKELDGISYMGTISNYHGGGYYQELSIVPNDTVDIVESLKNNLWITRATRAIFLDFTLYNANLNLFCVIKLLFEFPPTGGVLSSHDFTAMKLIRYVEPLDYVVMGFEFMFIFFVIFFTMEEVIEIMFFKLEYLSYFWNYIDMAILMLSYVAIVYSLHKLVIVSGGLMEELIENTNSYSNLEYVAYWEKQCNAVAGFLVFFVWIKLLKYLNVTHTTAQINEALKRCAKDLAAFGLLFFIAIVAYAQLGYSLFGANAKDFRGITVSVVTLLRTIVGYNIYESIHKADWFFAPLYYTAYVVFVFLILLNMFIAIIVYSYSEVKSEIAVMEDDLHLWDFLKRLFKNVLGKCGIYKIFGSKSEDKEKKLTYNDIREILRKCKFTDLEIEMFFAKYDITGERIVTEHDTHKMLRDMGWVDKEEKDAETEEDSGVSVDEFEELKLRVVTLEIFIDRLGRKINTVLERLEHKKTER